MYPLFHLFFDICLLRKGPQSVPQSHFLLLMVFIAGFVVNVSAGMILNEIQVALGETLVMYSVLIAFSALLLRLRSQIARLVQTLTTLFACDLLLTLMQIPVRLLVPNLDKDNPGLTELFVVMLVNLLIIWYVAIQGHIFRHAMSSSMLQGVIVSVAMLLMTWQLADILFGG